MDDESLIADTLAMILQQHGFESTAAYSGEEAVRIAPSWQPDVVLLDLVLGGMDGVEAAKLIAAGNPSARIMLFSGHPGTGRMAEALREGYRFEMLTKPVPPEDLVARIHRLCGTMTGETYAGGGADCSSPASW